MNHQRKLEVSIVLKCKVNGIGIHLIDDCCT